MEDTRFLRPKALKARLTDTRCKPSFTRLNMAMKGAYPFLLASKYSACCQRVYKKEILILHVWHWYKFIISSMTTHPNPKLMLFQSRPALKKPIMLNVVKTWRSLHSQRQCFIGPLASVLGSIFWVGFWNVCITSLGIISPLHCGYNRTPVPSLCCQCIISSSNGLVNTQWIKLEAEEPL